MRRRAVPFVIWVAGVVVAVLASTAAVSVVGERVTSRQVATSDLPAPQVSVPPAEGDVAAVSEPPVDPVPSSTVASDAVVPDPVVPVPDTPISDGSGPNAPSPDPAPGATGDVQPPSTVAAPAAPETPRPPAAPSPVDEVYATIGGTVAVRCLGPDVSLLYATPASGYALEPPSSGSGARLDVRIREVDGDHEVKLRVSCVDGVPDEVIEER